MANDLKEGTSNAHNVKLLSEWCSVNDVLSQISLRWKMVLLKNIAEGVGQFSLLKQAFPSLSDHVLGQRLRELVEENLVTKAALPATTPAQIGYSATSKGRALLTIIYTLHEWSQRDWSIEG